MSFPTLPFTDLLAAIVDNRGRTCPVGESGRPLIATNCVKNVGLYPSYDTVRYVDDETYATWFRGHPQPGDILFVCKGAPGTVAMVPDPVDFCIAQDMVAVRADVRKVHPNYLFAALRSREIQTQIETMHVGTMIPHFKKGDFDKLLIPMPPPKLQEFIGDTYVALSMKIESNRRLRTLLVETAKNSVSAAVACAATAELGTLAGLSRGFGYRSSGLSQAGTPMVSMGTTERRGWLDRSKIRYYADDVKTKFHTGPESLFIVNVDLTWKLDVLGWPLLVPDDIDDVIFSNDIYMLSFKPELEWLKWIVWSEIQTPTARSVIEGGAKGTTVASLGRDTIEMTPIRVPEPEAGVRTAAAARDLVKRAWAAERESDHLARLRDALLPELLSGRLHVRDAQGVLDGVV